MKLLSLLFIVSAGCVQLPEFDTTQKENPTDGGKTDVAVDASIADLGHDARSDTPVEKTIAFVSAGDEAVDEPILAVLLEKGYELTLYEGNAAIGDHPLVLLGQSARPNWLVMRTDLPIVSLNILTSRLLGLSSTTGQPQMSLGETDFLFIAGDDQFYMPNVDPLPIFTTPVTVNCVREQAPASIQIAVIPDDSTCFTILASEKNTPLLNGRQHSERLVMLSFANDSRTWTPDAWEVVFAAMDWAAR